MAECDFFPILLIFLWIMPQRIAGDYINYPSDPTHARPCSQRYYPTRFQGRICVPTKDGGWEQKSKDTCTNSFKASCPEFNKAECMWFELVIHGVSLKFPTCRLKYHASLNYEKITWMEINYVNQYGTWDLPDSRPPYILELHRYPKAATEFYANDMPNFPDNVCDSKTPLGLNWTKIDQKVVDDYDASQTQDKKLSNIKPAELCKDGNDVKDWCKTIFAGFVKSLVRDKKTFGNYTGPNVELKPACGKFVIEVDKPMKHVCRDVLWMTETGMNDDTKAKFTQDVSEYQLYELFGVLKYRVTVYGGNSIMPNGTLMH